MKKRQQKKIIKKDWQKKGIDFIHGNKLDLYEALSWIDTNLLSDFKSADMSWIAYVGDSASMDYDQSISYCPECAEKEVERLIESGEFKEGELEVRTDGGNEVDGCEQCKKCYICLDCCSLGTWINQELDHWEDHECDQEVLFNLIQTGADWLEHNKDADRTRKLLLKFFQSGEYQNFYNKRDSQC